MTSIDACFQEANRQQKKVFVGYFCMGYPTMDQSIELIKIAVNHGVDILEMGVPFSDPTADGPAIQWASQQAIENGVNIESILHAAYDLRKSIQVPMVLFSYANPIFVYGRERVLTLCKKAKIDSILTVDLPADESADLRSMAAQYGISLIPLVAPTSDDSRLSVIASALENVESVPRSFVYYVSVAGVTGGAATTLAQASEKAAQLRVKFNRPIVVGFGIDDGKAASLAAGPKDDGADGIVVGSALVRSIRQAHDFDQAKRNVEQLVREIRSALDA